MKITPDQLATMRGLIEPLDTDARREAYRDGNFPRSWAVKDLNTRYRWDLFYAAKVPRAMLEGLYDAHIDTALRRIVPPITG